MVAAKFLMRLDSGDVVSRCLNYRPGHYPRRPARRRLIFPVFAAGANFLASRRRVSAALAKPSRSDGSEAALDAVAASWTIGS